MTEEWTVKGAVGGASMRRIMLVVAAAALIAVMMAASAMPAFAVSKPKPGSCGLGFVVSHDSQVAGGLGHLPDN